MKVRTEQVVDPIFFIKLIENIDEGISLMDKDLNVIYNSSSSKKISGFDTVTKKNANLRDILHPEDSPEIIALLEDLISNPGQSKTCSFRARHANGSFVWLKCTYTNRLNEPEINGIICNFKEITAQKESEDLLQRSIQELSAYKYALDEAAIVAITNQKGIITHVNDNFCKISKYSRQELIGQDHRIINSSFHSKPFIRNLWKTIASGKIWRDEMKNQAKDGSYYWVDTTIIPFLNKQGKPYQYVAIRSDITARKLAQEQIRMAELEVLNKTAQIENLLENITDGFIALDENRCYTYANYEIGKMLGMDPQELIGKNIWKLFPDVIGSATYNAIELAITKKKYIINEDYYQPLNLWQENRIYPSGNGISMFIRNISNRKTKEIEKSILATIRQVFNEDLDLTQSLTKVLEQLANFGNFGIAEVWLIDSGRKNINRVAKFSKKGANEIFFKESAETIFFKKGEGLPGLIWEIEKNHFWTDIDENESFIRANAAKKSGLKSAYGIPLFYNQQIIGVLLIALNSNISHITTLTDSLKNIGAQLGIEIKRKELEQELNQVFNFTPDILCTANNEGYFTKVNPAMCQLLEYTEDELMSKPFHKFLHPLDINEGAEELENIINGKPTFYLENRYITKSGKIKWLAWTTTSASSEGIIYCSGKDITEKKELQELLDKANSLARIGGWEIDLVKQSVYWSDITREIHETEADYVPGFESGLNFYKEGRNRTLITSKLKEVIETGAICDEELEIITAKGNPKWVRVIAEAEFINDKCIRIHGSFQDINALKSTELTAKKVLEERNTILESIRDAFFAVDKNWIITYWNSSAEYVLHKRKEEVLNRNLWEIFSDSVSSLSYVKYHEALATNQAMHFEDHYEALHKWYEISAYPSEVGLSVYFKDITERKISELLLHDLNISLHQQAKELSASNAELEQFAYVASHDLQEPLRMVTSFLTQLELKYNDIIDDKGKKYIHFAVDGAKRMRQIILDLLEFSRIGRLTSAVEEINIEKIIGDILILYRKKIEEQKAEISFTNLPIVHSYLAPIRQLFQNLISNALKYKHPNRPSKISINCLETDVDYTFAIKDNGIGIGSEYFEKIFIIFQRLHNKDEYSGTGMGLAISKKIVENMGGKIWVESTEGQGSTFYFSILKNKP
ncbi:PAS domain S-box protein [Pedobacter sp. Du54]|uniref:PAS domain S-box protein n=1 Tax=Pedobacter anseongensis TaxID=3133439 RepID=UPI0030AFA808